MLNVLRALATQTKNDSHTWEMCFDFSICFRRSFVSVFVLLFSFSVVVFVRCFQSKYFRVHSIPFKYENRIKNSWAKGLMFRIGWGVCVCVLIWETVCCSRADEPKRRRGGHRERREKNMKMKYRAREKYTHSTVQVAETAQHWKLEPMCIWSLLLLLQPLPLLLLSLCCCCFRLSFLLFQHWKTCLMQFQCIQIHTRLAQPTRFVVAILCVATAIVGFIKIGAAWDALPTQNMKKKRNEKWKSMHTIAKRVFHSV